LHILKGGHVTAFFDVRNRMGNEFIAGAPILGRLD